MADIRIESESESRRGWRFGVRLGDGRAFDVRLSWSDYDLWGRGSIPPADVVRALIGVLIRHEALQTLGGSFDASTARRLVRTLDIEMPEQLAES